MTTKPCIACGEPIQEKAKRCPHCHFHQERVLLWLSSGWGISALALAALAFILYTVLQEPVRWSDHAATVQITEIKLHAIDRRDVTDMSCSGLLKSSSNYEWTDFVVEATFYAADGQAIDTATQRVRDTILSAKGEARVRVLDRAAWQASEYARCTLTVRSAAKRERSGSWLTDSPG
jgi:hypothetical protein